jgi:hypothetical protein
MPSNVGTWWEVRDQLGRILQGWSAYFSYATRMSQPQNSYDWFAFGPSRDN